MDREPRVVMACRVDYLHDGQMVSALSQDISRSGIFLRTVRFVPLGETTELVIHVPDVPPLRVSARVVHVLQEEAARALGRQPGLGMAFADHDPRRLRRVRDFVDQLELAVAPVPEQTLRAVIADPSPRLLERLSQGLSRSGFFVETASNGAEAFAACLRRPPDVVLASMKMPVVDGWGLLEMLRERRDLAPVPVALMEHDPSDLIRLRAFRAGAKDVIPKPFTLAELDIRLRRILREKTSTQIAQRTALRGNIAGVGVGTVLSLLEYERKSGILDLTCDGRTASILVCEGRIAKVDVPDTPPEASAADRLLAVLDWTRGTFRFAAGDVKMPEDGGLSTTHVLLEHARIRDEESKS